MNLTTLLLANGVLYGAFVGMAIATILVAVIPSWREAILDSHKQGKRSGQRLGNKLAGNEQGDVETAPVVRHSACPSCGCKKFKPAESKTPWADSGFFSLYMANDRCCKQCGTVYPMLFPAWARWLFMLMGLPIAIFGVALFAIEGEVLTSIMCVLLGAFIFAMGFCLPKH